MRCRPAAQPLVDEQRAPLARKQQRAAAALCEVDASATPRREPPRRGRSPRGSRAGRARRAGARRSRRAGRGRGARRAARRSARRCATRASRDGAAGCRRGRPRRPAPGARRPRRRPRRPRRPRARARCAAARAPPRPGPPPTTERLTSESGSRTTTCRHRELAAPATREARADPHARAPAPGVQRCGCPQQRVAKLAGRRREPPGADLDLDEQRLVLDDAARRQVAADLDAACAAAHPQRRSPRRAAAARGPGRRAPGRRSRRRGSRAWRRAPSCRPLRASP